MIPVPPWEFQGAILLGIAAVLTALGGIGKIIADIQKMKADAAITRRRVDAAARELHPNGGTSTRDSVDRTEALTKQTATELVAVSEQLQRLDRTVSTIHSHTVQIAERISLNDRRYDEENRRLWREVEKLKGLEDAEHDSF